jgi:AcrR family transcriptional regulator
VLVQGAGVQARIDELPRRRRTAKAFANDEAIRAAAIEVMIDSGWDAMTFSEVARRAKLTVGAVYGRAESKAELGADLWTSTLHPALSAHLSDLTESIASAKSSGVMTAMASWSRPSGALQAAVALSIAALFDDDLREVIGRDMAELLDNHCGVSGNRTGASAAAAALTIGSAFGRVLGAAPGGLSTAPSKGMAQREIDMSFARGRARALPRGPEIDFMRMPSTNDPHLDLLQMAALDVIGRVGYRRATVARICRVAQVSSGSMFARFDSKADLVVSAASSMLVTQREQSRALRDVGKDSGPAVAQAMLLRAFLDPRAREQRALRLELSRVARHEPVLQAIDVVGSPEQQSMLGLGLACSYANDLAGLPFAMALETTNKT